MVIYPYINNNGIHLSFYFYLRKFHILTSFFFCKLAWKIFLLIMKMKIDKRKSIFLNDYYFMINKIIAKNYINKSIIWINKFNSKNKLELSFLSKMKKVPSYPKITTKTNITFTQTQNININSPKSLAFNANALSSKNMFKAVASNHNLTATNKNNDK